MVTNVELNEHCGKREVNDNCRMKSNKFFLILSHTLIHQITMEFMKNWKIIKLKRFE